MFRDFEPAKLFFVLPANMAVLGSIASAFVTVSEHYALPDDLSDFCFDRLCSPFLNG
jgi:hypothetical protein